VRVLKILIAVVVGCYLSLLAILFVIQRRLLYYPSHLYVPLSDARANPAFREISVRTDDGIALKAWYAPATSKPYTIVFFHGNADCLYTASQVADPYIAEGYGFLLTEYRGYSGLPGTPTESGLYDDGRAYIRELAVHGVENGRIIVYGHSLGTGVAVQMAEEFCVAGLMLLAPYLSMPKLAAKHFPIFPAAYLTLDRFDNERKIGTVRVPLLVVNGAADEVVPAQQGRTLYSLANEPKEFRSIPNRGHNDTFDKFAPISLDWIRRICTGN
jgi:fermentation-respiration switch protein FrsA (DUF1100 family)